MPTSLVTALSNGDRSLLETLLADEVLFKSPVRSYRGRAEVVPLLALIGGLLPGLVTERVLSGDGETVTFLAATAGDRRIEGALSERHAPDGCITEMTLMLRPLKELLVAVERMGTALAAAKT